MKVLRYMAVGATAAAVDIGIFGIAVKMLKMDWFTVAVFSFLVATAVNYLLSIRYVFKSGVRFRQRSEIPLVFLVSGIGLSINQSVLWLLIESAELDEMVAKVLATSAVFLWNYTLRSRFIFKKAA